MDEGAALTMRQSDVKAMTDTGPHHAASLLIPHSRNQSHFTGGCWVVL